MSQKKTKTNKTDNSKKGLMFRLIKKIVSRHFSDVTFVGLDNIPDEPSIIVGNHSQMYGPLLAETKMPFNRYTWCIGNMLHLKEFPKYAYEDFWKYKPKWTQPFYKILSYIIAPIGTYIFNKADTIGVYKDARGISTFKNTVKALKQNNNIIIFPEMHSPFNEIINEFQNRFVDIGRFYFKETGKNLPFVPMYIAPKLKTMVFGKPIAFDSLVDIEKERNNICDYLKNEITNLAKDLPIHTVIPYVNISKKKYTKSQ